MQQVRRATRWAAWQAFRRGPAARWLGTGLALALLVFTIARTAWLSDEAYITLRVVDNTVAGRGLVWNPGERVQAYPHPLWLALLIPVYAATREPYITTLALSLAAALAAALVMARRVASGPEAAAAALAALIASRAFIDYSTAGLGTPLAYLTLALFAAALLRREPFTPRRVFWLALLAALAALARLDLALAAAPGLVYALARSEKRGRSLGMAALGLLPLLAWEAFSLVYYGALAPNAFYARLAAGAGFQLRAGLTYLWNVVRWDPATALVILAGIILPVALRDWQAAALSAGAAICIAGAALSGGGAQAGRWLAAPFFAALLALASLRAMSRPEVWQFGLVAVLIAGLFAPRPAFLSGPRYGYSGEGLTEGGIVDERGLMFACTGFWKRPLDPLPAQCAGAGEGEAAREAGSVIVLRREAGLFAYYAGPDVTVVTTTGQTDPFLARLPARLDPHNRIGRQDRTLPAGYVETLQTGNNAIPDEGLAAYYDAVALITRGALFDPARWQAIGQMNTGRLARLPGDRAFLADLAHQVTLLGWEAPLLIEPGADLLIETRWQTSDRQPYDYVPYFYLFGSEGWVGVDGPGRTLPVTGAPGEIVEAVFTIPLPADLPVGQYGLAYGILPPGWPLSEEEGIWLGQVGVLKVPPPVPEAALPVTASFGGEIALVGYFAARDGQMIDLAAAGPGPLELALVWQAMTPPAGDYHIFVHAQAGGIVAAQHDGVPHEGSYPTSQWYAGETVITTHPLDWPGGAEALYVGLYTWPDVVNLPAERDGQPVENGRVLLWP